MAEDNIHTILHVIRRDLRVSDNPILARLARKGEHGFTHYLPVHFIEPSRINPSGLIPDDSPNPYSEAKSRIGGYPRCGPSRAKFQGEAIWDMKESLLQLSLDLVIRVQSIPGGVRELLEGLKAESQHVDALWMVAHEGVEEEADQEAVSALCATMGVEFVLFPDEKFFVDDRDIGCKIKDVADVFTTYRKSVEPLREKPRAALTTPKTGQLPPLPDLTVIPTQKSPFVIPDTRDGLIEALVKPVRHFLPSLPPFPEGAVSAHPFEGGETKALARLDHLIRSEGMSNYKATRNGLIGSEFSTKLSAYLALGCLTARQIHHKMLGFENGTDSAFADVPGYGEGENEGTAAVRFELLWRDYMRLCHIKFGESLFDLEGFRGAKQDYPEKEKTEWKTGVEKNAAPDQDPSPERIREILDRFTRGTTGMGLIDASQRELMHTGYTSNRTRQNVASFLAKHLKIDWRYGAEWYEMLLIDYDVSSNWANWQYVAGVGNDPRSESRIFNPVKQAFDYDKDGSYVRSWVPEVRKLEQLENVFQAWTASDEALKEAGLDDNIMVTDPILRIEFSVNAPPAKPSKRPFFRRGRGGGRGRGRGAANGHSSGYSDVASPTDLQHPAGQGAQADSMPDQGTAVSNASGRGGRGGGSRGRGNLRGGGPPRGGRGRDGHFGGQLRGHFGGGRGGRGGRGGPHGGEAIGKAPAVVPN